MDLSIIVGGAAGTGLKSLGYALVKAGGKAGFHVFSTQDYMSRIRGGHNFFRIRFAEKEISSVQENCQILIALDQISLDTHQANLTPDGLIICDSSVVKTKSPNAFPVPFDDLAQKYGGSKLMNNSVALGSFWGLLGGDIGILYKLQEEIWSKKGRDTVEKNKNATLAGYNWAKEHRPAGFELKLNDGRVKEDKRLIIDGATAMGMGAIAAGCRFVSAYPMTPSTSLTEYLASQQLSCPLIVEQVEDEIAAIIMGIGAATAGARALVPTSGGGFSLMVEGLGLAGITETPLVIVNMQRPGPATGLPTRTEQADLLFSIYAHQGEFPRFVMAPYSPESAFETMIRAFNIAEVYQLPVIVLGDQFLADSLKTTPFFDFNKITINRGKLLEKEAGDLIGPNYKRHLLTEDNISPRALPGRSKAIFKTVGDEHDERGDIIEDANTRLKQHEKRLSKLAALKLEAKKPLEYGSLDASLVLVSWGSSYGAIKEAVDLINHRGRPTKMVHFLDLYPINPEHVINSIVGCRGRIGIEGNATGQFSKLIKSETGIGMTGYVLRYDGRPLTPEYIVARLEEGGDIPW